MNIKRAAYEAVYTKKRKKIKDAVEDKILYTCVTLVLILFAILVSYPLIYVLSLVLL